MSEREQETQKDRWTEIEREKKKKKEIENPTSVQYIICPRSSDPFYIVGYYIKWVTTSSTYSIL